MIEVNRALADLAEVRERLAALQRFRGISGWAAVASGVVAFGAGIVQAMTAPRPVTPAELQLYLAIWLSCLAFALVLNYGAIMLFLVRHWTARTRTEVRGVGMSIVPAIAAGGVLTVALIAHGAYDMLPGMWCAAYALGLFASRTLVPPRVTGVAVGFGIAAAGLLLVPVIDPLTWWIMPAAFGVGQFTIGAFVLADQPLETK